MSGLLRLRALAASYFRSKESLLGLGIGTYCGITLNQKFRIPPVANPLEVVRLITSIAEGSAMADPFKSLEIVKNAINWFKAVINDNF